MMENEVSTCIIIYTTCFEPARKYGSTDLQNPFLLSPDWIYLNVQMLAGDAGRPRVISSEFKVDVNEYMRARNTLPVTILRYF